MGKSKCLSEEWINKYWDVKNGVLHSCEKKRQILMNASVWTMSEDILLNRRNRNWKDPSP